METKKKTRSKEFSDLLTSTKKRDFCDESQTLVNNKKIAKELSVLYGY